MAKEHQYHDYYGNALAVGDTIFFLEECSYKVLTGAIK